VLRLAWFSAVICVLADKNFILNAADSVQLCVTVIYFDRL
jgi:hypothetical protein